MGVREWRELGASALPITPLSAKNNSSTLTLVEQVVGQIWLNQNATLFLSLITPINMY